MLIILIAQSILIIEAKAGSNRKLYVLVSQNPPPPHLQRLPQAPSHQDQRRRLQARATRRHPRAHRPVRCRLLPGTLPDCHLSQGKSHRKGHRQRYFCRNPGFFHWKECEAPPFWSGPPVDSGLLVISKHPILESKFSAKLLPQQSHLKFEVVRFSK